MSKTSKCCIGVCSPHRQRYAQHGVVLFITLIVLVAMSIAGIGLMRSVGANTLIAGNLALKEATTRAAEVGIEAGRQWALDLNAELPTADDNSGYYARWDDNFDPVAMGASFWTDDQKTKAVNVAGTPFSDYSIRYVIHRMCKEAGEMMGGTQECMKFAEAKTACTSGLCDTTEYALFRITVRVVGPKNTESYVQALLY